MRQWVEAAYLTRAFVTRTHEYAFRKGSCDSFFRGHFDEVSGWPPFLPRPIIARLSRVAFLQSPEDDVETGGNGAVPVPGGVLVAATGGGVGMAEAGHQLALGGAGPSGEGAGRVAKVVEVQFVVSHLVPSPPPLRSVVDSELEGQGQPTARSSA